MRVRVDRHVALFDDPDQGGLAPVGNGVQGHAPVAFDDADIALGELEVRLGSAQSLGQPPAIWRHRGQPVSGQTGRPAMYAIGQSASTPKPIIGPLNEV